MSNSMNRRGADAVDADLGVSSTTHLSAARSRTDVVRTVDDIQRHTNQIMNTTAPETILGKVIDAIAPSGARREKKRGDEELVRAEVDAQVTIHRLVKDAKVRQIAAVSDAYGTAAELDAANEVAARGLEVAGRIDAEIEITGGMFDKSIDQAVEQASSLQSASARLSAAERLKRRMSIRSEIEDLVMEGVRDALRKTHPRR